MISALNSAISGFNAASQRIAVSANNIANANSTTTSNNGVQENTPYVPKQVNQSAQTQGGVSTSVSSVTPASVEINDQNNVAAGSNGLTKYPNIDQAQQLVNTNIATYDAQANLTVIKAQEKLFQSTLNILS
jgi:flagellar basal body rod protein FlgC